MISIPGALLTYVHDLLLAVVSYSVHVQIEWALMEECALLLIMDGIFVVASKDEFVVVPSECFDQTSHRLDFVLQLNCALPVPHLVAVPVRVTIKTEFLTDLEVHQVVYHVSLIVRGCDDMMQFDCVVVVMLCETIFAILFLIWQYDRFAAGAPEFVVESSLRMCAVEQLLQHLFTAVELPSPSRQVIICRGVEFIIYVFPNKFQRQGAPQFRIRS